MRSSVDLFRRRPRPARSRRRLGITFALAVIVIGCGQSAVTPGPPGGPATAAAVDPPYRLIMELTRSTWRADEAIEGMARLELIGDALTQVSGSGGGLLAFAYARSDGRLRVEPAWTGDCVPHEVRAGAPTTSVLTKSGGWSDGDPDAAFYRAFFADPLVRLPAGDWEISAVASFIDGPACTGRSIGLRATVRVHVTP